MKIIKKTFSSIINFFDKVLIVPVTRFLLFLVKFLKGRSKVVEDFLSKSSSLIFISLVAAIVVFFLVNNETTALLENSATVLYDQPVEAIYNEEAYIIEGLPETADVTLIGKSSELYLARQVGVENISVDLAGLTPGTHKIQLEYTQTISSIEYKVDPSTATIIIYPKISEVKTLDYDLLNQESLDETLLIDDLTLAKDEVIIKGSEQKLEEVAKVKALIDIDNYILENTGTFELKNIPLIAYDKNGDIVEVEIVPETIEASITITSPHKEVPIRVIPVGELAFGYAISSFSLDDSKVTLYGDEDVLNETEYLSVELDVTDISDDTVYNISIDKPSGIRYMDVTSTSIKVNVGQEATKEIEGIRLSQINLADNLIAQIVQGEPENITVVLSGVESVLEEIDSTTIVAEVDLSGLTVGEHDVEIAVTGSDLKVSYTPKIKTIKIRITEN